MLTTKYAKLKQFQGCFCPKKKQHFVPILKEKVVYKSVYRFVKYVQLQLTPNYPSWENRNNPYF